jgi:hypothetical protein
MNTEWKASAEFDEALEGWIAELSAEEAKQEREEQCGAL